MIRSIKSGFLLVSAWPYQYARGMRALEDNAVGADVAAAPSGLPGEHVGSGVRTGATDRAPGATQPP
jgi:hypothetical protein